MASAIFIIIALGLIIILEYSLVVTAKRADEEAERLYREWEQKKKRSNRGQNNERGFVEDEERAN